MSSKDKKKDKAEPTANAAVEVEIDKEGALSLFSKKWSTHFIMLSGQKLLYKRREKDPEVKGQFELKGAKVEAVKDDKKEHAFEIKLGDQSMRLAAETAETAREWIEAINVGIAGTADKKGKKKQSLFMSFKKNVAGKAATSSTGKSLIKDQAGPDAVSLIKQLKEVIKLQDGKTKATEIEDNIFKVAVKVILLFRNKDISIDELLKPKDIIKQLWSDVLDMLEISFCYDPKRLQEKVAQLEDEFEKMLKSYVTEKTITSLRATMSYLGSEALLNRLYTAKDTEKLRPELEKTLRKLWDQVYLPQKN